MMFRRYVVDFGFQVGESRRLAKNSPKPS